MQYEIDANLIVNKQQYLYNTNSNNHKYSNRPKQLNVHFLM